MGPSSLDLAASRVTVTAAEFKGAGRRFASGVTVVTTRLGDAAHGATVSAFCTLSLEPLQVLISLGRAGRLAGLLRESGIFAVCILAAEQEAVSRAFASPARDASEGAFRDLTSHSAATGSPIISGCLAFFDCTVSQVVESGDHAIFIGDVRTVGAQDGRPLVYFNGAYHALADTSDQEGH